MDTITSLRNELHARRGEWPTMCTATGLSYWWLTKFAQGRIAEPGLSKVEKLQRYFADNPRIGENAEGEGASMTAPVAAVRPGFSDVAR